MRNLSDPPFKVMQNKCVILSDPPFKDGNAEYMRNFKWPSIQIWQCRTNAIVTFVEKPQLKTINIDT